MPVIHKFTRGWRKCPHTVHDWTKLFFNSRTTCDVDWGLARICWAATRSKVAPKTSICTLSLCLETKKSGKKYQLKRPIKMMKKIPV